MNNNGKMGFLTSGVFWGAIIILFGLSILLKEILHVHIPLTRIIFGIILLYIGIKVIAGGFGRSSHGQTVFGSSTSEYKSGQKEYNIIFGSGVVDLSKMNTLIQNEKIEVNTIFGSGVIRVNDKLPLEIRGTAAFGNVVMQNKDASGFGEVYYTSPAYQQGQPHLTIHANAVFGKLTIENSGW
jgi:predicted membrane protein